MFDPCWYIITSRKAGRRFKAHMKRLGAMPLAVGCWKIPFPNAEKQKAFADSVKGYVADGGVVEMFPLSDWEFACSRYVVGARG